MAQKILIVEDDPKSLKLIRDMLTMRGYITIEAKNGEEGIKLTKDKKPNLVLMDIMMPVMDGYTACREIKKDKATKAIPVIMVTSLDQQLNVDFAFDLYGANGYLTKPVGSKELLEAVEKFLPSS